MTRAAWRFWRRTLVFGGALVVLLTAEDLYANFSGPYPHTGGAALYVLSKCLLTLAWSLPLAAFAGGLAAEALPGAPARRLAVGGTLALSAGIVALLLSGWLGEWLRWVGLTYGLARGTRHELVANTLSVLWRGLDQVPAGDPGGMRATLAWIIHRQLAGALLTAVMAGVGLLVGGRTAALPPGARRALRRWTVGAALVLAWYAYEYVRVRAFGLEFPPAAFAYGAVLVPAVVLLALAWAAWSAGAAASEPGSAP